MSRLLLDTMSAIAEIATSTQASTIVDRSAVCYRDPASGDGGRKSWSCV